MAESLRELEDHKAQLQSDLETHKYSLQCKLEDHRNTLTRGRTNDLALVIIRSLVLVNGGAVIAILTFVGNLWTSTDADVAVKFASGVTEALRSFAFGVGFALLSPVFAFFGQAWASESHQPRSHGSIVSFLMARPGGRDPPGAYALRIFGIIMALISTALFFVGAFETADTFSTPPPRQ